MKCTLEIVDKEVERSTRKLLTITSAMEDKLMQKDLEIRRKPQVEVSQKVQW